MNMLLMAIRDALTALAGGTTVDAVETKVDTAILDIATVDGKVDTAILDIATVDGKVDIIDTNLDTVQAVQDRFLHGVQLVHPDLADELTCTGGAAAWQEGLYTEFMADSGNDIIEIIGINVLSQTGTHQITLGVGAAGLEVDQLKMQLHGGYLPCSTTRIPAHSRVAIKTASKAGGAQACTLKFTYRVIP